MEKLFTEDEAYELVNLFHAVTSKAKVSINGLNSKLEHYKNQPKEADEIQLELNVQIQKWSDKVRRLGGIPLALFKVKIPAQHGFFTWEFPSVEIIFTAK
ncbi:MAG: hypothetical protein HON90_13860 [Halobacteriovoraceae bacterium]|nr:hypothetical protein [Halobacteriovoraceae bacterium]